MHLWKTSYCFGRGVTSWRFYMVRNLTNIQHLQCLTDSYLVPSVKLISKLSQDVYDVHEQSQEKRNNKILCLIELHCRLHSSYNLQFVQPSEWILLLRAIHHLLPLCLHAALMSEAERWHVFSNLGVFLGRRGRQHYSKCQILYVRQDMQGEEKSFNTTN